MAALAETLSPILVNIFILGLVTSALYVLISVGFTMIYSVGRTINVSHATYVMIAAYAYWSLAEGGPYLSLPKGSAFLIAILIGVGASLATYKGLVKRFLRNSIAVFISTLILALLVEAVITYIFSAAPRTVLSMVEGTITVLGATTTINRLVILAVGWACIIALFFFVSKTHVGRAIRAISIDEKGGILAGINPERMRLSTWAWAGALSAIGGVLWGMHTSVTPTMWVFPLIMSFAVVIIGGLGSIMGALVAAHIIGFMEAVTVVAIEPRLRGILALILLIGVLAFHRKGLFGRE